MPGCRRWWQRRVGYQAALEQRDCMSAQAIDEALVLGRPGEPADACVDLGVDARDARAEVLAASNPRATNSADEPNRVALCALLVRVENRRACRVQLPPPSMATLRVGY